MKKKPTFERAFKDLLDYEEDQKRLFHIAGADCIGLQLKIENILDIDLVNNIAAVKTLKEANKLAEKAEKAIQKEEDLFDKMIAKEKKRLEAEYGETYDYPLWEYGGFN